MAEETDIRVNFGKPIPLFPIGGMVMLPQQVVPLHIFEPRYRQMMSDVLDAAGQIAMAVFDGSGWQADYEGRPPLRPSVCVGQIMQHEKLADGRYNMILQGVCRARIVEELPESPTRQYREAMLEPVEREPTDEGLLLHHREWLEAELGEGDLSRLSASEDLLEYVRNEDVPTSILMELLSFTLLDDSELRYSLLAEPDAAQRALLVRDDLERLSMTIRLADRQASGDWPKGMSWN
ncbi:MAG: LON peptidase substrate-binding domain-containing protein [Planctomycetota bacterium]